ncbi:phasin family protein [Duganella violaceipulchra]|uniref:Phasin family protein n=1 Tax=Duganella violaceipulchra TaxID=2849652 RepID=A0AA41L256_9BURK|nr:phasin family protein [Duganella violaceicalia]MBV6319779.1 phasin family protein [Duganella violaceicalia]MCP2006406.1 phasin family protein [Duganella violaceicalia]
MYPFSQSVTPAAKTHMEAQLAFFNDMSKSLFRTVQQYSDLNIQLAQTLLEESTTTGQQIITAHRPTEAIAAAAAHAQPTAEKLRAYQQHLSRIAADTQVDLSKVAEEHVQETSRTAKALADEVARVTSEETEKTLRSHQDAVERFSDPFISHSDGTRQSRGNEMRSSSTMQSASQNGVESREGSMQGGQQASQAQTAAQAAQSGKQTGARKET